MKKSKVFENKGKGDSEFRQNSRRNTCRMHVNHDWKDCLENPKNKNDDNENESHKNKENDNESSSGCQSEECNCMSDDDKNDSIVSDTKIAITNMRDFEHETESESESHNNDDSFPPALAHEVDPKEIDEHSSDEDSMPPLAKRRNDKDSSDSEDASFVSMNETHEEEEK